MPKNLSETEKEPKFLKYFSNKKITKSACSYKEAVLSDFMVLGYICQTMIMSDEATEAIHKSLYLAGENPGSKPKKEVKYFTEIIHKQCLRWFSLDS